jgi:hypothetical protein
MATFDSGQQPGKPASHRLPDRWFRAIVAIVAAVIGGPLVGIGAQVVRDAAHTQPCVVGTWNLTAYQETVTDDAGEFDFQLAGPSAATMTLLSNGTASTDTSATGVTVTAVSTTDPKFSGKNVLNTSYGLEDGTWSISGSLLTFKVSDSSGRSDFYVDGVKTDPPPNLQRNSDISFRFTCTSTSLTMSTDRTDERYSRPPSLGVPLAAGGVAFIVIGVLTWLLARHHRRRTPPPAANAAPYLSRYS